ncbi:hypothetical protein GCM10027343_01540 [Noviherbaspirillum agri]
MALNKAKNTGSGRRQVPSSEPLAGLDDDPIEVGATEGAQLPARTDSAAKDAAPRRGKRRRPGLNPNQGDLFKEFWPDPDDL